MEKICLNQSSIYGHPFPPLSPQFFYLPSSTQQPKKEKLFLVTNNVRGPFTCPPPSDAYGTGIWKRLISPAKHLILIYISNKEEIHENN